IDAVCSLPERTKIQVMAPVVRGRKGEYVKVFEDARKSGFVRVRVDGEMYELTGEAIKLEKQKKHNIDIVVDRLIVREGISKRLADSVETALKMADGIVVIDVADGEDMTFSQNYACDDCGISIEELTPRMFSFNTPYGACPSCMGIGTVTLVSPDLVIPDKSLSINQGAILASGWTGTEPGSISRMYYEGMAARYGFSLDTPIEDLPPEILDIILYGTKGEKLKLTYNRRYAQGVQYARFEGVIPNLKRRHEETNSEWAKADIENFMINMKCPECGGTRLKPEVLAVTVDGLNINQITDMSVYNALEFFRNLSEKLSGKDMIIAKNILKEIIGRLGFLVDVGLDYLTLSRSAGTLSGGEAQRIRLATQIGSSLMGVIYILDEPSIGLHQRDNDRLIATLKRLRDLGNTLLVVEHDEDTMLAADHIIDIGPGAGIHGGEIVAEGTAEEIMKCEHSVTGQYLSGAKTIPVPEERRSGNGNFLEIKGAAENNLKNVNIKIPLGTFTCVTGVSGSGKSSLINEILYKSLANELNGAKKVPGKYKSIKGLENLDKIIDIDQSPIGRTPRSNPATYTGLFGDIRNLFAMTPEAKSRGYGPGRFSFNVKGGRCESCCGDGIIKIEMHFLPDVYVPCEVCDGKRYNRETLEVRYKGKNIHEVLEMTVEEGCEFFENIPKIQRKLQTLYDVGLGYIKIGQPSTTLSGGEAQRVKLATELSKRSTGKTIYVLDEPTTGLHAADVHKLTEVLQKLVDAGNTIVVIEHNLDMIKTADYIIDLGPEGGDKGGEVVACGTPEQVARSKKSYTGQYLKKYLK
ncbi:MAG: excinuclease ABC subunit UvrA, partial [Clostridia bacterium]|nr:excinuclease ABC subunit UvrA [Clostridia bacterium]